MQRRNTRQMTMGNRLIKRLIWICVFAVLLYTAFVIYTDLQKNLETFKTFPWLQMPLILGAVLINFLIRELKWDYFRRRAGVSAPRFGSFLIFFSGFSMAISPGRIGELIKPFMYKEYFSQKMRRTIPLVFCERISDLLGMIVLAALAAHGYSVGVLDKAASQLTTRVIDPRLINLFLAASVLFMGGLLWFARQKHLVYRLLIQLSRSARLRRPAHKVRKLYYATYPLLTSKNLTVTTLLATISWSFECIALLMILHGVGATEIGISEAAFVFCMATIFGGFLFFLPGGLGGFESSMFVMLTLLGVAGFQATPAVFITRVATLFFGVTLGFIFILVTSAKYHKRMMWEEFQHADEELEQEV